MKKIYIIESGTYLTDGGYFAVAKTRKAAIKRIKQECPSIKFCKKENLYSCDTKREWFRIEKDVLFE